MSLYFEEEGNVCLDIACEKVAEEVARAALEYIKCPYETEVNLFLTTEAEIRNMNNRFRGIDSATDVLSFPMFEYRVPGDFIELDDHPEAFHPDSGELILGDIVISKERVLAQAESYGHSITREYAFLIAHSMLHLFGYDHMVDEERLHMEEMQKNILESIHILR